MFQKIKEVLKIIRNISYTFIRLKGFTYWPQHQVIFDLFVMLLHKHIKHFIVNLKNLSLDHTLVLITMNISPKLNLPHP